VVGDEVVEGSRMVRVGVRVGRAWGGWIGEGLGKGIEYMLIAVDFFGRIVGWDGGGLNSR